MINSTPPIFKWWVGQKTKAELKEGEDLEVGGPDHSTVRTHVD